MVRRSKFSDAGGGKYAVLCVVVFIMLTAASVMAVSPAAGAKDGFPESDGVWYQVKPGDTLYSIANNLGSNAQSIARANHVAVSDNIAIGQRLWIPGVSAPELSPSVGGVWYVVQPGDSLNSITQLYGSNVRAVTRANHIPAPQAIHAGQRLWIPALTALEAAPTPSAAVGVWSGEYYDNLDLEGPAVSTDQGREIEHYWGLDGPAGLPVDDFSARWNGAFNFDAGTYRMLVTTDDGARLFVDDELIIDAWRTQPRTGYFADLVLTEGIHQLRVDFFESGGEASIAVYWRPL